ncbi:hypothetical protein [Nocardia cyriacigeorgica]|uniref:hypothetical protein n=1 Tax=Nocardia cyriacigeorgica TaxID=135487 RepID=UPI001E625F3B|nr:hypothetical protein [Nocardia cyriacigeorgica]
MYRSFALQMHRGEIERVLVVGAALVHGPHADVADGGDRALRPLCMVGRGGRCIAWLLVGYCRRATYHAVDRLGIRTGEFLPQQDPPVGESCQQCRLDHLANRFEAGVVYLRILVEDPRVVPFAIFEPIDDADRYGKSGMLYIHPEGTTGFTAQQRMRDTATLEGMQDQ